MIETYWHLMPENLTNADRKIGRNESVGPPADEIAAMRAEIARLLDELETASSHERTTARRGLPLRAVGTASGVIR